MGKRVFSLILLVGLFCCPPPPPPPRIIKLNWCCCCWWGWCCWCCRSRLLAAGTQVLFTWVWQGNPRLLQQVRQRKCTQSFFAWFPQSWQFIPPPPCLISPTPNNPPHSSQQNLIFVDNTLFQNPNLSRAETFSTQVYGKWSNTTWSRENSRKIQRIENFYFIFCQSWEFMRFTSIWKRCESLAKTRFLGTGREFRYLLIVHRYI